MRKGVCEHSLDIDVNLISLVGLLARQDELHQKIGEIEQQVPEHYGFAAWARVSDGGHADALVEHAIAGAIPRFDDVTFLSGDFRLRSEPPRLSDGLRYLCLDLDPPLCPDHLGQIMGAVAPMLEARHTRIEEIFYYPAEMASDRRGLDTLVSPIDLNDFLPADEVVGWDECAVSGDWVFHVHGVWLYPAGTVREPYGVCDGKLD